MMDKNSVGQFIRTEVLPNGLSLNDASKQLGVSRSTLSRLLNGKSALSNDLATRIETAFGAKAETLLEMQSTSSVENQRQLKFESVAISAYSPSIFEIRSTDIENWADQRIEARTGLPVLLRRLINSTANEITHIDFPGNDDGERPGHDGVVSTNANSAWVPKGSSCWEFGVSKNPNKKANSDYAARKTEADKNKTFIFVTPRRWLNKKKWVDEKNKLNDWKEVRAYDASDLEQWLEISAVAQSWLAPQLNQPEKGVKTLDDYWLNWSSTCAPPISRELFKQATLNAASTFDHWISEPPRKALVIAADSKEEAIAFISCLFQNHRSENDRALVVSNEDSAVTLLQGTRPPTIVANHPTVEQAIAPHHTKAHCLIVRPRNEISIEIDIQLELLTNESFCQGLKVMGYSDTESERLATESGRSPTVLRRHPDIVKPGAVPPLPWSSDSDVARKLIGPTLLGMWNAQRDSDKFIVSKLATGYPDQYVSIDSDLRAIEAIGESPIWRAVDHIGMVSKIDTLFAISKFVTETDIDNFLEVARDVLSERDPALDLCEDDRWAAHIYNKVRDHSPALRNSIGDTLVIMSVDGAALFRKNLGIKVEAKVNKLIQELLLPLTKDSLLSQKGDFTLLAEAAPDTFLTAIENDLKSENPAVYCLLKPVESRFHGGTNCAELLWALELLAWKNLSRVNLILGKLSQVPVARNLGNSPINSLKSIYRYWIPQTAATEIERLKAIKALFDKYPNEALQVCFSIIQSGRQTSIGRNSRPTRRNDATGYGDPIKKHTKSVSDYRFKALEMVLAYENHSASTITVLLETVTEKDVDRRVHERFWGTVQTWINNGISDEEKSIVRHAIRNIYGCLDSEDTLPEAGEFVQNTFDLLLPADPVYKHKWLFQDTWVQRTQYELHSPDRDDYEARDLKLRFRRSEAIKAIWSDGGLEDVIRLSINCMGTTHIGKALSDAKVIDDYFPTIEILLDSDQLSTNKSWWLIEGLIWDFESSDKENTVTKIFEAADNDRCHRILLAMNFDTYTWSLVDKQSVLAHDFYWSEVQPYSTFLTSESTSYVVKKLLEVERPKAAFDAVGYHWKHLGTDDLTTLLEANTVSTNGENTTYSDHDTSEAFTELSKRADVDSEKLTRLEFAFLPVLIESRYGTPNIESRIQQDPVLFVQLLAFAYKRSDEGVDPNEWRIHDPTRRQYFASSAYRLLDNISIVPLNKDNDIDSFKLNQWIKDVREICTDHGRSEIGDIQLGSLLAKEINMKHGLPLPIAKVIDDCGSEKMANGFYTGAHNLRGVYMKSERGGYQEYDLAKKYRSFAENVEFLYPFTARALEGVAESYERQAFREDDELNVRSSIR